MNGIIKIEKLPMTITERKLLMNSAGNTIYSCIFTKKDGTKRHMIARNGATKGVTGTGYPISKDIPVKRVYDMSHGWRSINIDKIEALTIKNVRYINI